MSVTLDGVTTIPLIYESQSTSENKLIIPKSNKVIRNQPIHQTSYQWYLDKVFVVCLVHNRCTDQILKYQKATIQSSNSKLINSTKQVTRQLSVICLMLLNPDAEKPKHNVTQSSRVVANQAIQQTSYWQYSG